MKSLFKNALGVSVVLVTLIFTACTKTEIPKQGGENPPSGSRPTVSATSPQKGWWDTTLSTTVTVTGADGFTFTLDKSGYSVQQSGNVLTIPNVRQRITLSIAASNSYGSEKKDVVFDVFSKDTSYITGGFMWNGATTRYSYDSLVWVPGSQICRPVEFFTDGKAKAFNSLCSGAPDVQGLNWFHNQELGLLNWGSGNPNKKIIELTKNRMVLVWKNTLNIPHQWVEETYWR